MVAVAVAVAARCCYAMVVMVEVAVVRADHVALSMRFLSRLID
jgi:alkylhydroperoxidase/carboxymuconolactone decarboxylase family protein YurZ